MKVKATLSQRGIVFSILKKEAEHTDIVAEVAVEVFSDWSSLFGKADIQSERTVAEVDSAQIVGRGLKLRHILIEKGRERECIEQFREEAGITQDQIMDVLKAMRENQGRWIEVPEYEDEG